MYIVIRDVRYEGIAIVGVFRTMEQAEEVEKAGDESAKSNNETDVSFFVEEWELGKISDDFKALKPKKGKAKA